MQMKEMVKHLVKVLVDAPEEVRVQEIEGIHTTILEIRVSAQDVEKLIGRGGKNINAITTIVAAAGKGKRYYMLDVVEEKGWESQRRISKGKIKRLFENRDYGFIETDDGKTVYFHGSSLKEAGIRSLSIDEVVEFETEEGPKGLRATNVMPIPQNVR